MSEQLNASEATPYQILSRKSWTAYVAPSLAVGFVVWINTATLYPYFPGYALTINAIALLVYLLNALNIYTETLYYDETGVWVLHGFFPWNKGFYGVKWRDLDEAGFVPSFWGWIFRTYTVRVNNRYKQTSEISIKHMWRGDRAAGEINIVLENLIGKVQLPTP